MTPALPIARDRRAYQATSPSRRVIVRVPRWFDFRHVNHPILYVLAFLALLTASFDIFLNIKVYGSQVRFSQFFEAFFIIGGLTVGAFKRSITWPLGFWMLLCWASIVLLWTPHTYDMGFSVAYAVWFVISIVKIFALCQFVEGENNVIIFFKLYLGTFLAVAVFGIVQFVAGRAGISLLVKQWWFAGFPRVNGFSYEPSYYATYLITGWGMCAYLVERRNYLFSKRQNVINLAIISVALVLSSSRMGIGVVGFYIAFYILRKLYRVVFFLRIRPADIRFAAIGAFSLGSLIAYIIYSGKAGSLLFLLQGTGIGGTAAHSSTIRLGQFGETIDLFLKSPIVGYGVVGAQSYLGRAHGVAPNLVSGMNVTAEMLTASGLIGFPFFLMFVFTIVVRPWTKRAAPGPLRDALRASATGMALLFIILQFNQQIMRLYFWNHIAVVCVCFAAVHVGSGARVASAVRRRIQYPSYRGVSQAQVRR